MGNYLIFIFSGAVVFMLMIILVQHRHYRKIIKANEQGIVHYIHEMDKLSKELEYINVEKKVIEKMLHSKIDAMAVLSKSELSETN